MFSTDFIFRQQKNLVDNQKCQAGFRQLCNKILFLLRLSMEIRLFESLNHQEDNLKVWLLIKSVFYIVPKSSITLLSWLAVKPTAQFDKIKVY